MKNKVPKLLVLTSLMIFSEISFGTSTTGLIKMHVIKQLAVESISELTFSTTIPGARSQTLLPNTGNQNGKFSVMGEPGAVISITLPTETTLVTGQGNSNQTIKVTNFQSSAGQSGQLSPQGNIEISIGATRNPLSRDQEAGMYLGEYKIEVIY